MTADLGPFSAVNVGDVVQIAPHVPKFGRCLAIVDKVGDWGVQADIILPGDLISPVRLAKDEYVVIGVSRYRE